MELLDWVFRFIKGHRSDDCGDDGPDSELFNDGPDQGDGPDSDVWPD